MKRHAVLVVLGAACGGAQHPAEPRPDVRAEIREAEAAERARRHDVARQTYERAIADARDNESIGFARGRFGETLATWGEYPEAIAQLEGSVAAFPTDPAPWHDLGVVRDHEGDTRGALDAFGHAAKLAPTDWRPRLAVAALRWKIAAQCFRTTSGDCVKEVDATRAEYRAMLELDLPDRLREKVRWALEQLTKPRAGLGAASSPAARASGPTP